MKSKTGMQAPGLPGGVFSGGATFATGLPGHIGLFLHRERRGRT
ncbi:hypothetical protein [Methanogenium cariaci]|nr:hypothetical protein [Methanogenium cariaci]